MAEWRREAQGRHAGFTQFAGYRARKRAAAGRWRSPAGKHVYREKAIARPLEEAIVLVRIATTGGVRHGVIHDRVRLPDWFAGDTGRLPDRDTHV